MDGDCVLACDLGGTHLRVAALEAGGSVFFRREILTPKDDPTALARTMRFVLDNAGRTIVGAVVGVPGPVDYSRGRVIDLPNLPGWEDSISAAGLSQELDKEVLLANDADLAALGEHRFGAGRGYDDMVYVTSSTGVGAGVIIGGRLLHGRFSLAEVGHTIIDLTTGNTVESLGSGTALARLSGENPATVADRAKHGDLEALRQFSKVADAFAVGVFNLVHCFSPQLVVIGGGMSQAGELLLGPVREVQGGQSGGRRRRRPAGRPGLLDGLLERSDPARRGPSSREPPQANLSEEGAPPWPVTYQPALNWVPQPLARSE
jgi:glucokinase